MDISVVLGKVYGAMLLVVGLSVLNKRSAATLMEGLEKDAALLWLTGFVTFLIGAVSVALYNEWSGGWRVLITIFGWLTLIKGVALALFPDTTMSYYKRVTADSTIFYGGIIAVILGVVVLCVTFTA